VIVAVLIFEDSGQLGTLLSPSLIWSGAHAPRPSAEDGETLRPCGRHGRASQIGLADHRRIIALRQRRSNENLRAPWLAR
jgi:hypothetical protein